MTNDNKPPMFGPSATFDPATHESRSGKSALMNDVVLETLTEKIQRQDRFIAELQAELQRARDKPC